MSEKHECKRCGRCCLDVGTIFVHSEHPIVKAILASVPDEYFRDDGPCPMLEINGREAACLLHKHLGMDAKPEVCREYPEVNNEPCFREKAKD